MSIGLWPLTISAVLKRYAELQIGHFRLTGYKLVSGFG